MLGLGWMLVRLRELIPTKTINRKDPEQGGDAESKAEGSQAERRIGATSAGPTGKPVQGTRTSSVGSPGTSFQSATPMALLVSSSSLNKDSVLEYAEPVCLTACKQDSDGACSPGSVLSG